MAHTEKAGAALVPAPKETTFHVGQKLKFFGYAELQEGQDPIFETGDDVLVSEVNEDGSLKITSFDNSKADTAFHDEVALVAEAEPKAKSARAAKTTEKPVKAAAAAKPATEAPKLKGGGKAVKAAKAPKVKAEKAPKAPRVQVAKAPQEITIINTASVEAILSSSGDALSAAEDLYRTVEVSYFTLGGVLSHILFQGLFKQRGFDGKNGFDLYCESIGIGSRRGRDLVKIYRNASELGLDEERLSRIGWTKARQLLRVADANNANALIEFAGQHTRDELDAEIKQNYVETSRASADKEKRITFKFSLYGASAEIAESAIAKAKEAAETDDASKAFEQIVTDWASLTDGVDLTLEQELERISKKYGATVTVTPIVQETTPAKASGKVKAKAAA